MLNFQHVCKFFMSLLKQFMFLHVAGSFVKHQLLYNLGPLFSSMSPASSGMLSKWLCTRLATMFPSAEWPQLLLISDSLAVSTSWMHWRQVQIHSLLHKSPRLLKIPNLVNRLRSIPDSQPGPEQALIRKNLQRLRLKVHQAIVKRYHLWWVQCLERGSAWWSLHVCLEDACRLSGEHLPWPWFCRQWQGWCRSPCKNHTRR